MTMIHLKIDKRRRRATQDMPTLPKQILRGSHRSWRVTYNVPAQGPPGLYRRRPPQENFYVDAVDTMLLGLRRFSRLSNIKW